MSGFTIWLRSLPSLMVLFQRDYVILGAYQFFKGLFLLEENRRYHQLYQRASQMLSIMLELSRSVHNVMSEILPEYEELALEYDEEPLFNSIEVLVKKLHPAFETTVRSLEGLWKKLDTLVPFDKEKFGNRFSCTEHNIVHSINSTTGPSFTRDMLSNLSELLLLDILECSFRLIWSHQALTNGQGWVCRKQRALGGEMLQVVDSLTLCLRECTEAIEECDSSYRAYFQGLESGYTELEGIPISTEHRFSTEFKLYSNTISLLDIAGSLTEILGNIRGETLHSLREKSDGNKRKPSNIKLLQDIQAALDAKVAILMTHSQLEQQLLVKLIRSGSEGKSKTKMNESSSAKDATRDVDEEAEDGAELVEENSSALSYETCVKEDITDDTNVEVLDEFYEITTEKEDLEEMSSHQDNYPNNDGVHEARQVVLEQLKTVLKPRKEAMKTREEEAYKRIYGQLPSPSDDVDLTATYSKKKFDRQALLQELLLQRQQAEESTDVFEDADEDELSSSASEPDLFSADFMSRLDKTLKFGPFGSKD